MAALERLRRHVAQGAQDVAGVGEVLVVVELGQAEVGDPDGAAGVEQQVRGLDVAVEDALGVGVGQGVGDLGADAGDALPVAGPPRPAQLRAIRRALAQQRGRR